jgi:hypothetical protein
LRRHSQEIGFDKPDQLVRAFRAGSLTVFLDGFDETGYKAWRKLSGDKLKNLRKRTVELVRKFVNEAKGKCGLLVAGRRHFFDSAREMKSALALRRSFLKIELDGFTPQ